jgi:Fe(3+) dicitrate transport protein
MMRIDRLRSRKVFLLFGIVTATPLWAQRDTAKLETVVITAVEPLHVLGHLPALRNNVIYAGKKTEVILMDSVRSNVARDVERQILGRIPGASFSETQGAGFPSNGVGFRGLDPTQSIEMHTQQNGVSIAGDLFGYPETYFTPPSEALDRIEVVRGAGSLAFGPQVGGSINYVVRGGSPNTKPTFNVQQSGGSSGLLNSFNSLSGGTSVWTYYGFLHYRGEEGWRPNSDYRQLTAYGSARARVSDRLTLGVEYTRSRNRIHMAGGLSDEQFATDPSRSFRARNWLASPWNVAAARATLDLTRSARLESVLSYLDSDRHLVWRNEDGGPAAPDSTGPRELERETFKNWTLESRLRVDHRLFGRSATLATGVRGGLNGMRRFEGAEGSGASDFDMRIYGADWERALRFRTTNLALFAEELLHVTTRLSVAPGVRWEHVRSTASGYTDAASQFAPRTYQYPLLGVGAQFVTGATTQLYANVSQAYRPVLYASLTPFGSITGVDPRLHAARALNSDLGWRGTLDNRLKFDVGGFYLVYRDRIGTVADASGSTVHANVGDSKHRGVETYLEFDPIRPLDVFASLAYIDARYVSGEFAGRRVELAPRVLARGGLTADVGPVSSTLQVSHTGGSFGDASNAIVPTNDAVAGFIPSYTLLDWSGRARIDERRELTFGANNLANRHYFTKRTGEYPGPGILPGGARSVYAGIGLRF